MIKHIKSRGAAFLLTGLGLFATFAAITSPANATPVNVSDSTGKITSTELSKLDWTELQRLRKDADPVLEAFIKDELKHRPSLKPAGDGKPGDGFGSSVAVAAIGSILITDKENHRVLCVSPERGHVEVFAGTGKQGNTIVADNPTQTQLRVPVSVAVLADGSVLITDTGNHHGLTP